MGGMARRKRARPTKAVKQLPSGNWNWRIQIDGVSYSGTEKTEALAWEAREAMRIHKMRANRGEPTLASWGETWWTRLEDEGRLGHLRPDRARWDRHVLAWPGAHVALRVLSRKEVADWAASLLETEAISAVSTAHGVERRETGRSLSRASAKHCLGLVRRALAAAADEGLVSDNVAIDVRMPKTSSDKQAWTYLEQHEVEAVLALELSPALHALYATAIYAGLRKGELFGLEWGSVYLEGRARIDVRRSWDRAPKTRTSYRTVPLLPPAADALRRMRPADAGANDLVWPSPRGGLFSRTYDGGWTDKRARRGGKLHVKAGVATKAGIRDTDHPRSASPSERGRMPTFHALRHTCASHLVMGTWMNPLPLEQVRQWLGHSEIGVTQRYAHMSPLGLMSVVDSFRA